MRSAQVAVLAAVAILVLTHATPTQAHTCWRPATAEERIAKADGVFTGTVTSMVLLGEGLPPGPLASFGFGAVGRVTLVTFDVHEVWKGKNRTTLTVTDAERDNLGYGFRWGETYLVYGYSARSGPADYGTNVCTGNLWYTGENYINQRPRYGESVLTNDLEVLRAGKSAGQPPAFGVVLVVLGAAAVFVVLARALLLWRWRRR